MRWEVKSSYEVCKKALIYPNIDELTLGARLVQRVHGSVCMQVTAGGLAADRNDSRWQPRGPHHQRQEFPESMSVDNRTHDTIRGKSSMTKFVLWLGWTFQGKSPHCLFASNANSLSTMSRSI